MNFAQNRNVFRLGSLMNGEGTTETFVAPTHQIATGSGATMDEAVAEAMMSLAEHGQTENLATGYQSARLTLQGFGRAAASGEDPEILNLSARSDHGAEYINHISITGGADANGQYRVQLEADVYVVREIVHRDADGTVTTEHTALRGDHVPLEVFHSDPTSHFRRPDALHSRHGYRE
jgi:hypothetical protein